MSTAPVFQASGLASGLDTASIITQLVKIEGQPITDIQNKQAALKSQVSQLGDLASKLSALEAAGTALSTNGALAIAAIGTNSSFSAVSTANAQSGRYAIQVGSLATAAIARSQAFASNSAPVTGGSLHLSVMGTGYDVAISDGESLSDVAAAINQAGAPVNASVVSDGTQSYLSISNQNTGFPIGQTSAAALSVTQTVTGTQGQALGAAIVSPASNAQLTVNGLSIQRTSNTISDVVPGTTLQLKSSGGASEDLVLAADPTGTAANLQKFVDAYNAVQAVTSQNLTVTNSTDRTTTLAGDRSLESLQTNMQNLISQTVPGLTGVQTLADLGITTDQWGKLNLDSTKLGVAITNNPSAVNALFSTHATGIADLAKNLVESYVDPVNGMLVLEQQGMNDSVKSMDAETVQLQAQLDQYRQNLSSQFAAMEQIVGTMKNLGTFLTQQTAIPTK